MNLDKQFNKVINSGKRLYIIVEEEANNRLTFYIKRYQKTIEKYMLTYEKELINYINECEKISFKEKYFKKITKNQIKKTKKYLIKISKLIKKIQNLNSKEQPIYHLNLLLKRNEKNLVILNNMIFSYTNYKYDIEYNKYPNLNYSNLKTGDIILSIKTDSIIKTNPIFKLIYFVTKSHIGHATIFYKKEKKKYYFFDTPNIYNPFKKIKYEKYKMNYSKEIIGLVLRKKNELKIKEKEKLLYYLKKHIGTNYNIIKGIFLAIQLELYFHLPFYKNLKTPFLNTAHLCSENVTRAYEKAGIIIANKEDESTITPVDLLNSPKLEIIGYINHKQK